MLELLVLNTDINPVGHKVLEEKITTYLMVVTVFLLGIQELEKESLNKKPFQTGKKIIKGKEKIKSHTVVRKHLRTVVVA